MLEGRVAAAYSHLALLELSRSSARSREHRQRQECVALTRAAARLAAPLPVVDASSDLAIADTSAAVALGHLGCAVDAPGSRTSWTTTVLFLELAHDDVRKAWRAARRFAAQADEESRRRSIEYKQSLRKIKSLQDRLAQERRANTALQQEAVSAGVRASESTKQVALDNTAKLQEERAAAHRDSLRDMRMCVFVCISQTRDRRDIAEEKLRKQLATSQKRTELCVALTEAMRYGLGLETARRKVCDRHILKLAADMAQLRGRCNDEIRAERAHSARIELWVHAMRSAFDSFRSEIAHRETLLNMQQTLDSEAQRSLKYELWRQATAVQLLGLDVDTLVLYFAQRMAALAGAHRTFNDALRE